MRGVKKQVFDLTQELSDGVFSSEISNKMCHNLIVRYDDTRKLRFNMSWLRLNPSNTMLRRIIKKAIRHGKVESNPDMISLDKISTWSFICPCGTESVLYRPPRKDHTCICGKTIKISDYSRRRQP